MGDSLSGARRATGAPAASDVVLRQAGGAIVALRDRARRSEQGAVEAVDGHDRVTPAGDVQRPAEADEILPEAEAAIARRSLPAVRASVSGEPDDDAWKTPSHRLYRDRSYAHDLTKTSS